MKKFMVMLVVVVMLLQMTGCGKKGDETAKKGDGENKILIYTSMYEDIIEAMTTAISKAFPDMEIEFFYGGTGTLQSKIAAEIDAGQLGCDMLMVAEPSYSLELMDKKILHPYKSVEAKNLAFDYDLEGYWYPVRVCNMVLAYNPEKYSKEELPNSFYDFANDSSVKGMISMSNPLTSGTAMASVTALLDKYGEEYFEALGKQNVAVESGSVAVTKLETGECKEIMVLEESVLKKREEEGSKLEVIYPTDGVINIPSTIMTVNDDWSAHKNTTACEKITDWFLSEEGQTNIVDAWMHSPRKDYKTSPYDARPMKEILENTIPIDWNKCYKERETIRTQFQEHITTAQQQ